MVANHLLNSKLPQLCKGTMLSSNLRIRISRPHKEGILRNKCHLQVSQGTWGRLNTSSSLVVPPSVVCLQAECLPVVSLQVECPQAGSQTLINITTLIESNE